jgi:hypothetical protein
LWFNRGVEVLNRRDDDAARSIACFSPELSASDIFKMTSKSYLAMSAEERLSFDLQAAVLCVMLRKELGQIKLLSFLSLLESADTSSCLTSVYGFKGIEEFDSKYESYCSDLLKEFSKGNVPNKYFTIKGAH